MANSIDLDLVSGQVIQVGNTSSGTGAGQIAINNTPDGQVIASLDQFLDFGGALTKTANASTLTIDIYGRVVGFAAPDEFYFSTQTFTATSGQTVFTPTARNANYITGQDLIFQNGLLLSTSDYTETSTTFTLNVGATLNDRISVISMRAKASSKTYVDSNLTVSSVATSVVTYDSVTAPWQDIVVGSEMTFSNVGTPTTYTVSAVNYTTREITFTTSVTATAGNKIYHHRNSNDSYPTFMRREADVTTAGSYTPTLWNYHNGYELIFINGCILADADYDIVTGALTNFPANATGKVVTIQFNDNNLTTPVGDVTNLNQFTVPSQTIYNATFTANAFNLYANGVYLIETSDYTTGTNQYTLASTPDNNTTILLQQSFTRTGAA